ncbi:MAG: PIN domain-containing protein [Polaromonas sp.]|nr:PIN domain-containing protein [Polaromonas sp.]
MQVVVDTSVWSLVLRRRAVPGDADAATLTLKDLVSDARAMLIGPVRQELLSGIKDPAQFEKLRSALAAFPDEPLTVQDYECAAGFFNICKAKGIQGSHTDFLICAVAKQRNLPVFSLDQDFVHFSGCLPLSLFGKQI